MICHLCFLSRMKGCIIYLLLEWGVDWSVRWSTGINILIFLKEEKKIKKKFEYIYLEIFDTAKCVWDGKRTIIGQSCRVKMYPFLFVFIYLCVLHRKSINHFIYTVNIFIQLIHSLVKILINWIKHSVSTRIHSKISNSILDSRISSPQRLNCSIFSVQILFIFLFSIFLIPQFKLRFEISIYNEAWVMIHEIQHIHRERKRFSLMFILFYI